MDKRFSWIFLAASAAFFLFIVGLTGYRIEAARRANTASADGRIRELALRASELRDAAGGFEAPSFKEGMRSAFDRESRLLMLSIHSEADGMLYLVARNRSYLREPGELDPDWRGTPSYQYSRGYEVLASRPVEASPVDAGSAQASIDALFVIMGREDLYPVLRDDLYLFLAFLLVCGVFILIVTGLQLDEADGRARPPSADLRASGWAERTLLSPSSGLVWAEHLEPRLRAEIDRAASSDQDISFASLSIDGAGAQGARSAEGARSAGVAAARASIAKLLRETFTSHDLLFEIDEDSFAVILPDTDIDQAVKSLEAVRRKAAGATVEGKARTLSIGVSSRAGRLVEEKTLLEEGGIARVKASREGGNRVVGFRADPARYRRALSG
jgi:GGDEF domain-containing protein